MNYNPKYSIAAKLMKSTLKDGAGKNLLFESTIFTGTYNSLDLRSNEADPI